MSPKPTRRVVTVVGAVAALIALLAWLGRQSDEQAQPARIADVQVGGPEAPDVPLMPPRFAVEPLEGESDEAGLAADGAMATASTDAASGAPLLVTVLHAGGAPAAGTTVVAATGEEVIDAQFTDAQGAAQFAGADSGLDLYVGGATLEPQRFHVEPARGEHRIELPPGAFVGGLVLIDGQPAAEPVGLRLIGDRDWIAPIPDLIRARLSSVTDPVRWPEIGQFTTDSRFLFSGLPQDWSGMIGFPSTLQLESREIERYFDVERPATDLVVRLTRTGAVIGRVLEPSSTADAPQPAAFAGLLNLFLTYGGRSTLYSERRTDGEGRFRIPLPGDLATTLDVQIKSERGGTSLHLPDLDPHIVHDLGNLVLTSTQRLDFLALDDSERPIEGAVASTTGDTSASSRPTGADGLGVLPDILPGTSQIRVDALGYEPAELSVPAISTDGRPVRVHLMAGSLLDLSLHTADGQPARGVTVEFRAPGPLFDGTSHGLPDRMQIDQELLGFSSAGENFTRGRMRARADGHCFFGRVRPGLPMTLFASDAYGAELHAPESVTLLPGERRLLDWTVSGTPRVVRVTVRRASDGTPVAGAIVELRSTDPALRESKRIPVASAPRTNAAGETECVGVFASRVSIQARHASDGAAWLLDQDVPPEGARFELALGEGRQVEVEVVDADGQPFDGCEVSLIDGPRPIVADELDDGLFQLDGVPPGLVTLQAEVGRRGFTLQHDSSLPRARIVIPRLGGLSVRWTMALQPDLPYSVILRGTSGDTWSDVTNIPKALRTTQGPLGLSGSLLPGDYDVVLQRDTSWREDDPAVSRVARVHVNAGETAEVTLEP